MADESGVRIVTPAGDLTDEDRRDFAEMRGLMDGAELRKMKRRNGAIVRKRRERGDTMGTAPFGYAWQRDPDTSRVDVVMTEPRRIAHVVDTYRRERTYLGTARALDAEGRHRRRARRPRARASRGATV
jgi:hypothetical protein